jgi:hypothetical protein
VQIEVVWILYGVHKPSGFIAMLKEIPIEIKRETSLSYFHLFPPPSFLSLSFS